MWLLVMNSYLSDYCSIIFWFTDRQNHMRIHPMFLHSNATSHKWAFGGILSVISFICFPFHIPACIQFLCPFDHLFAAIAELLDNAVDEVSPTPYLSFWFLCFGIETFLFIMHQLLACFLLFFFIRLELNDLASWLVNNLYCTFYCLLFITVYSLSLSARMCVFEHA